MKVVGVVKFITAKPLSEKEYLVNRKGIRGRWKERRETEREREKRERKRQRRRKKEEKEEEERKR
jgi:hypothetical protein